MDIIKQISILLWVLGAILIAPPVLRYFDIDVKTAYRKVLMLGEAEAKAPAPQEKMPTEKKNIDPKIFDELFVEHEQETSQQRAAGEQEVKKLISGMENISHVAKAEEIVGVPVLFRAPAGVQEKVRWLPPPPGFMTGETFNYLIYREEHPVGDKLKSVLDTIHGNLMLDLTPFTIISKPSKILVMLFDTQASYMNFTKRPAWSGAVSDLQSDTMYVMEGKSFYPLSVHELTHLYFDGYFLPSVSPLWLSEGMAVYMQIYSTKQKPGWVDPAVQRILQGQYIALDEMVEMNDISHLTSQQAELWYTQAYTLVDYLLNERSRDEFYRFCNELKAGSPVHQALYRAYGMPFTKVSVLQNVWLHDLSRHAQGHLFTKARGQALPAEVLQSTQTVKVTPARQNAPKPKKTVIPKLQKVEMNAYRGGF